MRSALKAWLFATCAIAGFGCTEGGKTQVLTGRVTTQNAVAVRAIDGDTVITAGRVRSDGTFTLSLPAGHRYRLEVMTDGGVHNVVGVKDGALGDITFKVCDPQPPWDMGGFGEPGCDPTDPNGMGCGDPTPCDPNDPDCKPWPCDPTTDPMCPPPCDPMTDPNCGGGGGGGCDSTDPNCVPPCDPMTDPSCQPPPPCDPATDPNCKCYPGDPNCPVCDPMTDPNCQPPPPPCDPMTDPNCGTTCDPNDPTCQVCADGTEDPYCKCDWWNGTCEPCDPMVDAMCPTPPPPCDDPTDPNTCKDPCMVDPVSCGCGMTDPGDVMADGTTGDGNTCWPPPEPCTMESCPDDPWSPENPPGDFGCGDDGTVVINDDGTTMAGEGGTK
ncbi:MAG TPA: hypothetical protein VIV40_37465 [Kofleriaceae bacterium]